MCRRWEAAEGGEPCMKSLGKERSGVGEFKRENLNNVIGASPQRGGVEIKLNEIKSLSHSCSLELFAAQRGRPLRVDSALQVLAVGAQISWKGTREWWRSRRKRGRIEGEEKKISRLLSEGSAAFKACHYSHVIIGGWGMKRCSRCVVFFHPALPIQPAPHPLASTHPPRCSTSLPPLFLGKQHLTSWAAGGLMMSWSILISRCDCQETKPPVGFDHFR